MRVYAEALGTRFRSPPCFFFMVMALPEHPARLSSSSFGRHSVTQARNRSSAPF